MVVNTSADGGGHLWFYSQNPDTLLGPQPLPNPRDYDPKYHGADPDPWLSESIVIPASEWMRGPQNLHFDIWLGCAQFESLETKLVVSINDAAHDVIEIIEVQAPGCQEIPFEDWDTSGDPPGYLEPHGVFNSAEFWGCAEYDVHSDYFSDLYSPPNPNYKAVIEVILWLKSGVTIFPKDAKIHFDAYGHTEEGNCIFSTYSHDSTFVIPEIGPLFLMVAMFSALTLYALRRKTLVGLKPLLSSFFLLYLLHEFYHHLAYVKGLDMSGKREETEANWYARKLSSQ